MRLKHLLVTGLMVSVAVLTASAQKQLPIIQFHTQLYDMNGSDHSFHFSLGATEDTYVDIDFGFGATEYEIGVANPDASGEGISGTTISGQVGPDGVVQVYGDPSKIDYLNLEGVYIDELEISQLTNLEIIELSHNLLQELDLSNMKKLMAVYVEDNPFDKKPFLLGADHPDLVILEMANIGSVDQSLDLKDYPRLMVFDAYHTLDLRRCDPTGNPNLVRLSLDCTAVETLDVTQNPELAILNISETKITQIDLSNNSKLSEFYASHSGSLNTGYKLQGIDLSTVPNLQVLMISGNGLTDIDLSKCPQLFHLSIQNNNLTSLDIENNKELYNVYIYNNYLDFATIPADRETFGEYVYYQRPISLDRSYPAGGVIDLQSRLNRPNSTTTAVLMTDEEVLGEEYYNYKDGKIEFLKATPDSVYFQFSNSDFVAYGLETTKFIVKEEKDFGKDVAAVTWRLRPSGKQVTLNVGMAGASDDSPKHFSVDFGDGNPVEYTATTDKLDADAQITADKRVGSAMTLYIPEGEDLTAFSISDTPLSQLNLTAAHSLTTLVVNDCGLSNIDLGWNRCLSTVNLNNNSLTSLDLSGVNEKNVKNILKEVYANDNNLSEIILSEYRPELVVEVANNNLNELDLTKCSVLQRLDVSGNSIMELSLKDCEALTYLNASDNDLSSMYIPDYTPLETLDISLNRFPLPELPLPGCVASYSYAPQKEWMIPEKAPSVNLSAQYMSVNGKTTTFKWYSVATGEELTSAQISGNGGKFKFLDSTLGEVYCVWSNPLFPDFNGDNAYRSTKVLVAEPPLHVAAKFMTTEQSESEIIMRSAIPNNYVYIDWAGDGNLEAYPLDHTTYTIFPATTYPDAEVKLYTYDDRDGIDVLTLDGISMSSIDLGEMTDLATLGLANNGLTAESMTLPSTALRELRLSGNDINGLDLSVYPSLYSLVISNCGLTEFDASPFKQLGNFAISGNTLSSLKLDNPQLWNMDASSCDLTDIDLSGVPMMRQLWLSYNKLTEIEVSGLRQLIMLDLSNNYFTLTTLPRVLSTYAVYNYYNQALYPVTVKEGNVVDLSDQLMVGVNRTNYRWFRDKNVGLLEDGTIAGDELIEGYEYSEEDGVFTFYAQVKDAVCVMTNVAFPNLIFISEPVDIRGTGVESVGDDADMRIRLTDDQILVSGIKESLAMYSADGMLISCADAVDGEAKLPKPARGIYVLTSSGRSHKIIVK